MGKKRSELEDDEIPEVIRDAVFQEPQVAEVSAVDYELVGRGLEDKAGIRRLEPGGVHVLTYTTTFQ